MSFGTLRIFDSESHEEIHNVDMDDWMRDNIRYWHVQGLLSSAEHLERVLEAMPHPSPQTPEVHGLITSRVILLTLAAEVGLKMLLTLKAQDKGHAGHDLSGLYHALPAKLRDDMDETFRASGMSVSLRDVLEEHKDNHTRWRYRYEIFGAETGDLEALEHAIRAMIKHYDPDSRLRVPEKLRIKQETKNAADRSRSREPS